MSPAPLPDRSSQRHAAVPAERSAQPATPVAGLVAGCEVFVLRRAVTAPFPPAGLAAASLRAQSARRTTVRAFAKQKMP